MHRDSKTMRVGPIAVRQVKLGDCGTEHDKTATNEERTNVSDRTSAMQTLLLDVAIIDSYSIA